MAEENLIAEEDQDYINSLPSMNSDNDHDDDKVYIKEEEEKT